MKKSFPFYFIVTSVHYMEDVSKTVV